MMSTKSLGRQPHETPARGLLHHLIIVVSDVDRFYAEVLAPLAARGLCTVEDPPGECPEYDDGYYATFFRDPDGLKFEFVVNEAWKRRRAARAEA